jgi:undecaprenyl pyrophosphate synthase
MKYQFTLSRAHKVSERINLLIKELESEIETKFTPMIVKASSPDITAACLNNAAIGWSNVEKLNKLLQIREDLRNSIAAANVKFAVTNTLTKIEGNKKLIEVLESICSLQRRSLNTVYLEDFNTWKETLKKSESELSTVASICVESEKQIAEVRVKIKKLKEVNFSLLDDLSDLNGNKISIELEDSEAVSLGLSH